MGQSFPASLRAQPFVTYSYAHRTRLRFYGNLQKFSRQSSFSFSSVSFLPFMVWVTFPRGTVFIMGPNPKFFFSGPNMEKHFKRCLCLLFFKLVPDRAPSFGQTCHWPQANGAELMLYFLIRVCLPGTGSQLWAEGLCALGVWKYFVSNPKDEVTRLVCTTRRTAGTVPLLLPWKFPVWATCLFILGESTSLAWVDSGLQLLMPVSPISDHLFGYPRKCKLKTRSRTGNRQIWDGRN